MMLPHSRHGFYCHSSLPDDLGIQYQSYAHDDVVAEDDVLRLLPGLGHTGTCICVDILLYNIIAYLYICIHEDTYIHISFVA